LTENSEATVYAEEERKVVWRCPHLLQTESISQLQLHVLFCGTGCCPQQCHWNNPFVLAQLRWAVLTLQVCWGFYSPDLPSYSW